MSLNIDEKREHEKKILGKMIFLYCQKHHGMKVGLCGKCEALREYAYARSDCCPFMETKTFCSKCKVNCYKGEMREKIRTVMRFSGIRLLFRNPIIVIRHLILSIKKKSEGF